MTEEERKAIDAQLLAARQALNLAGNYGRARDHILAALELFDWPDLPRLKLGPGQGDDRQSEVEKK